MYRKIVLKICGDILHAVVSHSMLELSCHYNGRDSDSSIKKEYYCQDVCASLINYLGAPVLVLLLILYSKSVYGHMPDPPRNMVKAIQFTASMSSCMRHERRLRLARVFRSPAPRSLLFLSPAPRSFFFLSLHPPLPLVASSSSSRFLPLAAPCSLLFLSLFPAPQSFYGPLGHGRAYRLFPQSPLAAAVLFVFVLTQPSSSSSSRNAYSASSRAVNQEVHFSHGFSSTLGASGIYRQPPMKVMLTMMVYFMVMTPSLFIFVCTWAAYNTRFNASVVHVAVWYSD
ncbi:hypothetical protein EJ110_NYTH53299 [Nymphaea thermarum]|nr:hypothetical protein EJ110_NYTH53299 [Nymphaea thermarum]